jgi:hypothetical protein
VPQLGWRLDAGCDSGVPGRAGRGHGYHELAAYDEARGQRSWSVRRDAGSASGPGAGTIAAQGGPACRSAWLSGMHTMGQAIASPVIPVSRRAL